MTNTVNTALKSEEERVPMPGETDIDFDETTDTVLLLCEMSKEEITGGKPTAYPPSNLLFRKACLLYQKKQFEWIEALADFQEKQAECLLKDGKEAAGTFTKAFAVCRWMSEESRYLPTIHPDRAEEIRQLIFDRMDRLRLKQEVCRCIGDRQTEHYLRDIIRRLNTSGALWHGEEVVEKALYLLSYDADILSDSLPLITELLYVLSTQGLLSGEQKQTLSALLEERVHLLEAMMSDMWLSDNPDKLRPHIAESLQLLSLLYLLSAGSGGTPIPLISARICRYLSRLPSSYSELLKNKSYTLLAGETTLGQRIRWEDVRHFDEMHLLEQIVLFHLDGEELCHLPNPENKWLQCHNEDNTLTLDRDGFTLSPRFPNGQSGWKGRKDKATVLNDRFFIASFSKLPFPFEACKNIKDFRLYWKQLTEDFPTARLQSSQPSLSSLSSFPATQEQSEEEYQMLVSPFPKSNQRLTVRVLFVDRESQKLHLEIVDKEYAGMKAFLPFLHINASYALIPDFAGLFTEQMLFAARVKRADNREVIFTLIPDYNEYLYAASMRQRNLIGRVTELFDGKVQWLLSSGATAVTGQVISNKFKVGDYFKVWYNGLDTNRARTQIKTQMRTKVPDEAAFLRTVAASMREFLANLIRQVTTIEDGNKELQELKSKNNPFVIALRDLNFEETADELPADAPDTKTAQEEAPADDNPSLFPAPDIRMARELLYCLDMLADELENPVEKFNAFNSLALLSHFIGDKALADYYQLCCDYIYQIDMLTSEPCHSRFTQENIARFSYLLKRMELSGIGRYNRQFGPCGQIIRVMEALFVPEPLLTLQAYIRHQDKTVSELARYFSITFYLHDNDEMMQQLAYKSINRLLGLKDGSNLAKSYTPVFFGHEGVQKEFKTSAFVHAKKDATEDQSVVLARVLASFMNTDGGTLYVGVNDHGYLNGLTEELKHTHNDSDVYLRTVNNTVIRQLGEKDEWNRFQEYIRCRLYEYEDGRQVLGFRVPPIREVVTVRGVVYTRSASSNTVKPVSNVPKFNESRRLQVLDSRPRQPEFPSYFSAERGEIIFGSVPQPVAEALLPPDPLLLPEELAVAEAEVCAPAEESFFPFMLDTLRKTTSQNSKFGYDIGTSALRSNPLQKKAEHGYTPKHLFLSIFNNGKIAYSPSPKIGVWGKEKGKVICSYNPDDREELLVSVYLDGQVGISNLKKGLLQPNTPTNFLDSPEKLIFLSPASKKDYLLLISERDREIRYRFILLDGFEKSMGIQPLKTVILEPDKGTFVYTEIIPCEQMKAFGDDKVSLDDFDRYNGGRFWAHSVYEQDVKLIGELCKFSH